MGKVYAASDFHGNKVAFKLLDYLQPDDKLYFLGDAIDRGPYGFELMDRLKNDPRVIYLKGNHEQMMIDAIRGRSKSLWLGHNGGDITWETMRQKLTKEEIKDYIESLDKHMVSTCISYINKEGNEIILEHAGFTPWGLPFRSHDSLWDRDHFNDKFEPDGENVYIVHGHTPVIYLRFYYDYVDKVIDEEYFKEKEAYEVDDYSVYRPTILHYCNGHKIDIDMCSILTDRVALLDLDTFEEIYFDKE